MEMPRRRIPEELRKRIRELRLQGWSIREIAKRTGVSTYTVWQYVQDLPAERGKVVVVYTGKADEIRAQLQRLDDDALFPLLRALLENRPRLLRRLFKALRERLREE